MHALTVKQPWAEAIARHGKTIENRRGRPPAHLIGQRIAIHVGKGRDEWDFFSRHVSPHLDSLLNWMQREHGAAWWACRPPQSGMIIATARLVGWNRYGHDHGREAIAARVKRNEPCCYNGVIDNNSYRDAPNSPWFTGPVGWVLADVRPLAVPVGMYGACAAPRGIGGGHVPCNSCGHLMLEHQPIRGQLYPFALSAEVEAAILRQESDNA